MKPAPKIWYIFWGRFPSEKATSLARAKSCASFAKLGCDITLLVPYRAGRSPKDYREYYGIDEKFPVVFLPIIDAQKFKLPQALSFRIGLWSFSRAVYRYIKKHASAESDIVYSTSLWPLRAASRAGLRSFYELHDFPEKHISMYRKALRAVTWILSTNNWKKEKLIEYFAVAPEKILVEPNAVEVSAFAHSGSKEEARARLGIPLYKHVALYTGHLYSWKGVDTLAQAAALLPGDVAVYFVGGTDEDIKRFKNSYGHVTSIVMAGHRPHAEIAHWQAAADVLVLPNTAKEKISTFYTSPLKLFEYMASRRPIVASDLPSIREILNDKNSVLVPPDDPKALAQAISGILKDPSRAAALAGQAYEDIKIHNWEDRAKRILSFIEKS